MHNGSIIGAVLRERLPEDDHKGHNKESRNIERKSLQPFQE